MESSSLADVRGKPQAEKPAEPDHNFKAFEAGDFKLVSLRLKNAETKQVLFERDHWDTTTNEVINVEFPKETLLAKVLSREMTFYSKHPIENFKIL